MRLLILLLCFAAMPLWAQESQNPPTEATQTETEQAQSVQPNETQDVGTLPPPDYTPFEPSNEPPTDINRSDLIINTFGSLLFVLALILILGWAARKFLFEKLGVASKQQGRMFVIQHMPLGPRRYVSLIECDGKRYLLGVTDHNVNLIKAIDDLDFDDAMKEAEAVPPPTVSQLMGEES
jgi:flagellar biosynthetic protein FliO